MIIAPCRKLPTVLALMEDDRLPSKNTNVWRRSGKKQKRHKLMRSDLNEVYLIDQYLLGRLSKEDEQVFETNLLLDETIAEKLEAQRTAHQLIRRYARKEERRRLEEIYQLLLNEPDFAHQIKII